MIVRSMLSLPKWNILLFSGLIYFLILQINEANCENPQQQQRRKPRQDDGDGGDDGDDGDDAGAAGAAGAAAAGANPLANNPYINTLTSIYSVVPQVLGTVTRLSNSANELLNGTDTPNVGSFIFKQSLNAAELIQMLQRMNQANQAQGGGAGGGGGGFQLPGGIPGFLGGLPGLGGGLPSGIPGFGSFGVPASPPIRKPPGQNPWPGGNPYSQPTPGGGDSHKQQELAATSPQSQTDLDADYYPAEEDMQPVGEITTTPAPTRKPRPRPRTSTAMPVKREVEVTPTESATTLAPAPPTNILLNSVMPDKTSLWNIYKSYHSSPDDTNGVLNHFQLAHPGAFSNDLLQNLISSISPVHEQISLQNAPLNRPFSELLKRPSQSSNEGPAPPPKISYPPTAIAAGSNIFSQSPGITWSASTSAAPATTTPKPPANLYLYPPVSVTQSTTNGQKPPPHYPRPSFEFNRPSADNFRPSTNLQRPVFNIQRPYPNFPRPSSDIQNQHAIQNSPPTYQQQPPTFQNPPPAVSNPSPTFQNPSLTYQNPSVTSQQHQTITVQNHAPNFQNPPPTFQNPSPVIQQNSPPTVDNPPPTVQSYFPNFQNPPPTSQNPSPSYQNPSISSQQHQPITVQNHAPTYQNPPPAVPNPSPAFQNQAPTNSNLPPTFQNPSPTFQKPPPTFQNPSPTFQQTPPPTHQNNPPPTKQNSVSVTEQPSVAVNKPFSEFVAPSTQNIETSEEVIRPASQAPLPQVSGFPAYEHTQSSTRLPSPSRPPSMILNAILSSDSVEKQPANSKFKPGKPAYWMNMYYPSGLPVLTQVLDKQEEGSIREPRI